MNADIKPDWRLVKVKQTGYCDAAWLKEKRIKDIGLFYLVDANLHVHICSFTPTLEMWPMQAYVLFEDEEASEADEGETEMEMLNGEEPVSYYNTNVLDLPWQPATNYVTFPEPDEGETDADYRMRCADELREVLQGNPTWF